jgi:HPt (histidine-containing phosphotransfer) domain-containing protein
MIVDRDRVLGITRNNSKLLTSLVQLLLTELPTMICDIETAFANNDPTGLADAVHKLKSALGNFAIPSYHQQVAALEAASLNFQATDWWQDWLAVKTKLDQLCNELTQMAGI